MSLSRRELLMLAGALPGFRGLAHAEAPSAPSTPIPFNPAADDEPAWERIAQEFVINGTHLNTGTYGSCPLPVLEATIHHLRSFERMIGQEGIDMPSLHLELEAFLGAWPGSVAIVRNTTEAMNVAAAGLNLSPGDEIVSTTHEHVGGKCCWELLAARRGVVYRTFEPPLNPARQAEQAAAWMAQVTPRTKVFSISHVHFTTGMIQPVQALVRMARERGIITVIDGAHPPGLLEMNLQELDADFYASSPHKWLLAPKGSGLLVVRPDKIATTWPLVASGNWNTPDRTRFEHVGTIGESMYAGLRAAVAFQQAIGPAAIEQRVRGLATQLQARLADVPGIEIFSPHNAEFRSAMVSFRYDGRTAAAMQSYLGRYRIRTRRISEGNLEYIRLSTHIYNFPRDLERVVGLLREMPRG
jgi:selenocysteine lyase/cysteine desulfurase